MTTGSEAMPPLKTKILQGADMNTSKFIVGQTVEFLRGPSDSNVPHGTFTITRVMPRDSQDRSYRVRSSRDGQERVLTETQLRAATGSMAS